MAIGKDFARNDRMTLRPGPAGYIADRGLFVQRHIKRR